MRRFHRALIALTVSVFITLTCVCIYAANTYTETVNLAKADRNLRGDGYTWNNPDRILTLDGISISTDDDFGIKLPAGSRVVLKGSNRIVAGKYGIGCPGSVIFEGDGTLMVGAEDAAIYSYTANENHKLHFMDGEYELKGGKYGILSDCAEISVTGGELNITGSELFSAKGRVFTAAGGSFTADAGISMSHLITLNRSELTLSSTEAALVSENMLEIKNVTLLTGDSADALTETEEYSGEKCISTVPDKDGGRRSVLFGDNYSAKLDYAVMSGAAVLIIGAVVLPVLNKKRKTKKLYQSLGK